MSLKQYTLINYAAACFFLLISLTQCKEKPGTDSAEEEESIGQDISEAAVSELYQYYVENPVNLAHKEENEIIDHIISTGLAFQRTASGLYYHIIKEGEGPNYTYGGECTAHYKGYFLDGKTFDSSYQRQEPLNFRIGQMNAAWNEILQNVNPGTHLQLIAPSRMAYGERGFPGYVPPNTIIAFDIETLVD